MAISKKKLIGGGILGVSLFALIGANSDGTFIPTFLSGGGGSVRGLDSDTLIDEYSEDAQEPKIESLKPNTGNSFADYLIASDSAKYPNRTYDYSPKTGVVKISDSSGNVIGGYDLVNRQSVTGARAEATFNDNPILNSLRSSGGSSGGSSKSSSKSSDRASGGGSPSSSSVSISTAKDKVVRDYENKNLVSTTKTKSEIQKENKAKSSFFSKIGVSA